MLFSFTIGRKLYAPAEGEFPGYQYKSPVYIFLQQESTLGILIGGCGASPTLMLLQSSHGGRGSLLELPAQ